MQTIKPTAGQTLIDLAMQYCGDASALPQLALMAGLSCTAELEAGAAYPAPDAALDKGELVKLLNYQRQQPSSGDTLTATALPGGIGYMQIGNDFIVT